MKSEVWLYPGAAAAWYFISLPKKEAEEIKQKHAKVKRGWGSLPVSVTIGKTTWKTSIFPDKKAGTYLLPVKADIRRKEHIAHGDIVRFSLVVVL